MPLRLVEMPKTKYLVLDQTLSFPSPSANPVPSSLLGEYKTWHESLCPKQWNILTANVSLSNCVFSIRARRYGFSLHATSYMTNYRKRLCNCGSIPTCQGREDSP